MTSSPVETNPWVPHRRELRGVKGNIIQLRYRRSLGTVRASHHRGIDALRKRIDDRRLPIVDTLAQGIYTAVVRGAHSTEGTTISELYDVSFNASQLSAVGHPRVCLNW